MWFSMLALLAFANLHDGVKSNPLPVAVESFTYTPVSGYPDVPSQATTWDTARKSDSAIVNSEGVNLTEGIAPYFEGSEISMVCNVDDRQAQTVLWYKDDTLIQPNNRINITAFKLIISSADETDAGQYRCEAAHKYTGSANVAATNNFTIPDPSWLDEQAETVIRQRRSHAHAAARCRHSNAIASTRCRHGRGTAVTICSPDGTIAVSICQPRRHH